MDIEEKSFYKVMKNKIKSKLVTLILVFAVLAAAMLFSCSAPREWEPNKVKVLATTTMLTDLSKEIGGNKVSVIGLMNAGVDPHQYKASTGDVRLFSSSQVVVYSGLGLEGKLGDIIDNLENKRAVICATDGIDKSLVIDKGEGSSFVADPHFWFDVTLYKKAAEEVTRGFISADSQNADYYNLNLKKYLSELDVLDSYIRQRAEEVPEERRVLVTAHDAFGYFGRAYGFTVKGIQGINSASEAGTGDISRLADYIAEKGIKAVFVETSVPGQRVQALIDAVKARDGGLDLKIGGSLYSDSIGDAKSNQGTYILSVKANIDTIVDALK